MSHRRRSATRFLIGPSAICMVGIIMAASGCSARPPGTVTGGLMSEYDTGSTQSFNTPGQGRVEFLAGGKIVASVTAGAQGSFQLSLPPGRYIARWPGGKTKRNCTLGSGKDGIDVRSGEVTHVTLLCPTATLKT